MDGGAGFSVETGGVILAPVNVIVGSSAIMAMIRPAQPGWLSTTFGIVDTIADIFAGFVLIGA